MKTRPEEPKEDTKSTMSQFALKDKDPTPEPKPEPKEETSSPVPVSRSEPSNESRVLLSHQDAYIFDRMKTQPKTLDEIEVLDRQRPEEQHRLSLPQELKEHQSRFAFRWLFKHKQAIDHACNVRGWFLVNRTHFPDLPNYLFTVSGSIEEGDAILSFMPIKKAEEIRREPGEKSSEIIKSRFEAHRQDPRFYTPEEKGEKVVGI